VRAAPNRGMCIRWKACTACCSTASVTSSLRSAKKSSSWVGLHPGTDIDAYTAAALDGADLSAARRHLAALYDLHLLIEPVRGRYRFHDLIREHARNMATSDPAADQQAASDRLLDYYLHTARAADRHLVRRIPAAVPDSPAARPAHAPDLQTRAGAVAWMDADRLNLHAAVGLATAQSRPVHAVGIPAAMHEFLRGYG
jgi:DNA-binding transcriptional ArsR family regulator